MPRRRHRTYPVANPLDAADRISPGGVLSKNVKVFPEVSIIASFLQTQASFTGEGDFRAYTAYETFPPMYHPDTLDSGYKKGLRKRQAYPEHYWSANAPLDCITYHPDHSWTPSDQEQWDQHALAANSNATNGHQQPFPESILLLTIQFVFVEDTTRFIAAHEFIESAILVVIDRSNKNPILCAWTHELDDKLPTQDDLIEAICVHLNLDQYTQRHVRPYIGDVFCLNIQDPINKGAQILLKEDLRRDLYTPAERAYFKEWECDNWGELYKRIVKMAGDDPERRVLAKDFRQKLRFESKWADQVETTQIHSVARTFLEQANSEQQAGKDKAKNKNKTKDKGKYKDKGKNKGKEKEKEKGKEMSTTVERPSRGAKTKAQAKVKAQSKLIPFSDDDEAEIEVIQSSDDEAQSELNPSSDGDEDL